MDVVCHDCRSEFRISDEKIPPGKAASFVCPKCKNRTIVDIKNNKRDASSQVSAGYETTYDASEKPFDFIETEGKTALICASDSAINQPVTDALRSMAYHISNAQNARDALRMMWYHIFDLIVIDENFDTGLPENNPVMKHLEDLNMSVRRNIYVAMISKRFRTMDQMIAFNKSVNLIINAGTIDQAEQILKRGLSDQAILYQIYKEYIKTN